MYYGYGILAKDSIDPAGIASLNSEDIKAVYIDEGPLAVLCGVTESNKPTVAGIRHYNKSLCQLAKMTTIIPLMFGTVFHTDDEIHSVLRKNQKKYLRLLETFNGTFEVELKISWEKDSFQNTMLSHKKLARWKNALAKGDGKGYDLVEFGRAVQETADQERRRIVRLVMTLLKPLARNSIQKECTNEFEAYNGVFLIERDNEEQFDQTVDQLALQLGKGFSFKYTGPWPVHHFIE
ncbi:GvpL/GvpF family gas vesicle protein [Desulfosporosinus sp. SYSU MS00001]|uniref:GvpL/GvpF family gas vesicle protein n=1 Tax=Desulfosporosinus sp. SYSU MS00001 TaxID=3416284 RepID=UPI003CE928D5